MRNTFNNNDTTNQARLRKYGKIDGVLFKKEICRSHAMLWRGGPQKFIRLIIGGLEA